MDMPHTHPADTEARGEDCSVSRAIGLIGGKWKLYVIRILLVEGPQRFNRLLDAVEGISPKVLTQNLRDLQSNAIVERVDADGSQLYRVTESGERLRPALHVLGEWADAHVGR